MSYKHSQVYQRRMPICHKSQSLDEYPIYQIWLVSIMFQHNLKIYIQQQIWHILFFLVDKPDNMRGVYHALSSEIIGTSGLFDLRGSGLLFSQPCEPILFGLLINNLLLKIIAFKFILFIFFLLKPFLLIDHFTLYLSVLKLLLPRQLSEFFS